MQKIAIFLTAIILLEISLVSQGKPRPGGGEGSTQPQGSQNETNLKPPTFVTPDMLHKEPNENAKKMAQICANCLEKCANASEKVVCCLPYYCCTKCGCFDPVILHL
ncbi:uncharacterized protein LOC126843192 [Adelges cooleyi]|uniref:uncharacterized protein LOC126843192 n=1 Tax=Adelges cooleyi TaxID=133065 RepID=UPI00217FC63B|nr:uncharacterized protein LOC126843192 [Adelges cooleyi]